MSVHYQSIFIDTAVCFTRFIVARTHITGNLRDEGNCADRDPSCLKTSGRRRRIPRKWRPSTGEASCDCPANVCSPSQRARHILLSVSVPLVHFVAQPFSTGSVFLFFLCFSVVIFQLLRSSKQVLLKDSHYVTLEIHVNSWFHLEKEKHKALSLHSWQLQLLYNYSCSHN